MTLKSAWEAVSGALLSAYLLPPNSKGQSLHEAMNSEETGQVV